MGLFDKVLQLVKPKEVNDCASGYPDWKPNKNWVPDFNEEVEPEAYDGN